MQKDSFTFGIKKNLYIIVLDYHICFWFSAEKISIYSCLQMNAKYTAK